MKTISTVFLSLLMLITVGSAYCGSQLTAKDCQKLTPVPGSKPPPGGGGPGWNFYPAGPSAVPPAQCLLVKDAKSGRHACTFLVLQGDSQGSYYEVDVGLYGEGGAGAFYRKVYNDLNSLIQGANSSSARDAFNKCVQDH